MKKKNILFLASYPKGIGPSQRFRFEQYLGFISEEYNYKEVTFWNKKGWDILFSDAGVLLKSYYLLIAFLRRVAMLFSLPKYQLVFIQREVAHIGPPVFEWMIKFIFRKKIIYDFDDAIWFLNYSEKNKIAKYFKAPWKVKYICKWSDAIMVGNSYLANYARQFNDNVHIIPTTIDTSYHYPKEIKRSDKLTIGWTGTLTTLKQIELILPVLRKLEQKYDFRFLVISNLNPEFDLKSFEYQAWQKETEIEDLQKMDIGVMPLFDNEWEKGKCGFKGLQYMALEVSTIMSPVGVNSEIIQDGANGFLAASDKEWEEKLSQLIENEALRKQFGKEGRKTIEERYSVNANKNKYLEIIGNTIVA